MDPIIFGTSFFLRKRIRWEEEVNVELNKEEMGVHRTAQPLVAW
jgi:hypothetical protein